MHLKDTRVNLWSYTDAPQKIHGWTSRDASMHLKRCTGGALNMHRWTSQPQTLNTVLVGQKVRLMLIHGSANSQV